MESNQAQCLKIQDKYADKVETFAKCVVKAAKAVHKQLGQYIEIVHR